MNLRNMCLNWKFIVGVGVAVLAVVVIAPRLAWAAVPFLFVLVCPLMMLVMMRGMGTMGSDQNAASRTNMSDGSVPDGTREERLAALKARNESLAREIAQIEDEGQSGHEPVLATRQHEPPRGFGRT